MSRKGKLPIELPSGVEVKVEKGEVSVKGPKGTLVLTIPKDLRVEQEENVLRIGFDENHKNGKAFHGLYRSLIANMVEGTTKGYEKQLEMIGVGYRASVKGKDLDILLYQPHGV